MTMPLEPRISMVPNLLDGVQPHGSDDGIECGHEPWLRRLIGRRREFGITRIGSVARLDRVGIPVVQVARPLSLSNAVSQGKGLTWSGAIASGLMESIEGWAGENIPRSRLTRSSTADLGAAVCTLYEQWVTDDAPDDWDRLSLTWLEGCDLFTGRATPVPASLVDTIYTLPSPHPAVFPRTTTGLAAGRSLAHAVIHAGLEILERDGIAEARCTPRFFDTWQTSLSEIRDGPCSDILAKIKRADLLCGAWQAPTAHDLPVYWCHLMERGPPHELVPLPSEGFGCDLTHEGALAKAILEACQARVTAISGSREDITRLHFPREYDRAHLDEWREQLSAPPRLRLFPRADYTTSMSQTARVERVLDGLRKAGASAAIVVPMLSDQDNEIHVVRLICPPLRLNPRACS